MAGLSIKRHETVERIRRVAKAQGLTITDAVDDAMRQKEIALGLAPSSEETREADIAAFFVRLKALMPPGPFRTDKELDEELYDEDGLPS